jgi:membrane protein
MKVQAIFELLKATYQEWTNDRTSRLGAALAYYAVFSLAPVLVIVIAVASLVFGEKAARGQVAAEVELVAGPEVGRAVEEMLSHTHATGAGWWATAVSIVVLLFSATAVFAELQDGLNTIWGVKARPDRGWLNTIRTRFWSFMIVLGLALLLLLALAAATAVTAVNTFLGPSLPAGTAFLWRLLDLAITLGLLTLLFAMIYKVLPDVKIAWRDVWVGAVITAVLFTAGTYLIGLYLGWSSVASAYGAAGSPMVLLLWVYYSSQVLLFGAEFTQVYACKYGRPLVREDRAEPVTPEARARQGMSGTKSAAERFCTAVGAERTDAARTV